nr:MAG TPA: hypothetical protein [Caudoviricetes sp.]
MFCYTRIKTIDNDIFKIIIVFQIYLKLNQLLQVLELLNSS